MDRPHARLLLSRWLMLGIAVLCAVMLQHAPPPDTREAQEGFTVVPASIHDGRNPYLQSVTPDKVLLPDAPALSRPGASSQVSPFSFSIPSPADALHAGPPPPLSSPDNLRAVVQPPHRNVPSWRGLIFFALPPPARA